MLTNNFQAIMVNFFANSVPAFGISVEGAAAPACSKILYNVKIKLGTGTTPAKRSDYKLEAPIDESKYNCNIVNEYTQDYSKENSTVKIIGTITNTGDDAIIVKELGLYADNNNSASKKTVMLAREVLEKPVTLEPRKTISYEFQLF